MALSAKAYAMVLGVALAASVTSIGNGYVYDDVPAVRDDPRIRSLGNIPALLASPYWHGDIRDRIYRPATTVSFALDRAIGGASPAPFHVTNVLLHLLVTALVLTLAAALMGRGAVVAGLWFALHPVHVEAVANIVGRSELLAAAAYLGAVLAYRAEGAAALRAPASARRALLALLVLACAALAFGAKEHALTLPATLLLMDAWQARADGGSLRARATGHLVLWLGVVALGVGYLGARATVVGSLGAGSPAAGLQDLTAAGRAMVMMPAFAVWAQLLLWPLHLSADYSPDAFVPSLILTPGHLLGAGVVVAAAAGAWLGRRRLPAVTFGLLLVAITASVATNIATPTGVTIAERVLYLPSAGAAIVLGALWERLPPAPLVWPATALVLALLGARAVARIPVWHDEDRFFDALVHDAPDSYRTFWAKGARAFERRDGRTGEQEMRRAIQVYPGDGALIQELGERYLAAGLYLPADRFLTAAYRVDSLRSDAAVQAVLARTKLGHADSAAALGEEALRRFPDVPTLLLATSDAYLALGLPMRALVLRRRITYAAPRSWQFQHLAAFGAAMAGRCDEARARLERAVAMAPADEEAPHRFLDSLDGGPTCGVARP